MPSPVTLLMAIHCHQPVGNFGFVFEEAYAKAYEPFVGVLERHPGVRLSLHYSGCLLDWLTEHRPTLLARVRALVARGQVELLASGYGEPILPLLPEADRQGQIAMMRAALRRDFGEEADGLWLTERVWEPDLPATLSRAGIRYTMLDVNQFLPVRPWLPAGQQAQDEAFWDLFGSYATECGGESVRLFPASKRLRYWLPFQPVDRTLQWLSRLQRQEPVAVTFADDGEKFGFWPKTFQWVYESGWLDDFFSALERERGWLATSTFRDYAAQTPPAGRVYLPSGSYDEMLEWSGGAFRNFFVKYPEANALQQKMLRVSQALQHARQRRGRAAAPARLLQQATRALYLGQCNCAYWHGVFGGLYLSHLRRAVYGQLIEAERLLNRLERRTTAVTLADADGDGRDEACVRTSRMSLVVDPDEGGAVTEWNLYGPRLNLLDTLTRRPEAYHERLKAKRLQAAAAEGQPASIHDLLGAKEEDLGSHLAYDDHRRSFFLDYGLERPPTLEQAVRSTWGEGRLWSAGAFRWDRPKRRTTAGGPAVTLLREQSGGRIRKTIRVASDGTGLECRYALEGVAVPVLALEFNLALRDARYLARPGQQGAVSQLDLDEPDSGVRMRVTFDPPATVLHFPVETVSESEGGMERTSQGLCLLCVWTPPAGRAWQACTRWDAQGRLAPSGRSPSRRQSPDRNR